MTAAIRTTASLEAELTDVIIGRLGTHRWPERRSPWHSTARQATALHRHRKFPVPQWCLSRHPAKRSASTADGTEA
jgi:hypothetical protein